jgi:subtilisin-like proprotein convertase family protein
MRRVDAEGESRGVRGQQAAESRSRSKLRRAAIEWLERRELLSTSTSTLPSPTVFSAPSVTPNAQVQDLSLATAAQALTANPSASSPSVSVDPLNSKRIVATWVEQDPAGYNAGNFNVNITSYLEGAYSTDGGLTWSPITSAAFGVGGNARSGAAGGIGNAAYSVNVQLDFSITPSPGVTDVLSQTTDGSIGYDRSENFYILSSTHDDSNAVGVIDLQRFSWPEASASPSYTGITQVYSWDTPDSGTSTDEALTPTLAVDSNPASYTDPATGQVQTDQYSGNVYAVWASVDSNTYDAGIPNFNKNTIRMAASSNQGVTFTPPAYVDDSSNANGHNNGVVTNPPSQYPPHDSSARYSAPQVTVSEEEFTSGGGVKVPGGQVTIVYDDYGTVAPLDQILAQTNTQGGTSNQFAFTYNPMVATGTIPNNSFVGNVVVPLQVSLSSSFTLQDLAVSLSVEFPSMANFAAVLVPPAAVQSVINQRTGQTDIVLMQGDVGVRASGTPDSTANLGFTSGSGPGSGSGTVFDVNAIRSIEDGTASSHAVGFYQPDGKSELSALQGLSGSTLSGTWELVIAVSTGDSSTTDSDYVAGVNLNFSQGNNPGSTAGTAGDEVTIAGQNSLYEVLVPSIDPTNSATTFSTVFHTDNTGSPLYDGVAGTNVSGSGDTTLPAQAATVLPAPVITSDDTLGSFGSFAGRIYVAFTGKFTGSEAGDTDVFLAYSDNGGSTWSTLQQVNDDNAATDGFSGASDDAPGNDGITGNAQYDPQLAVDQSTGDVVVSFYDARNDPSNARVATYIAASNDGATLFSTSGTSPFAAQVYANPSATATNAINAPGSNTVNLGPIPDNQSATGGVQKTDGYGTHQALIVSNGRIIPFWTSNGNMAVNTAIVDSVMELTAGPRIISSTQGPVGLTGDTTNTSKDSSGTTLANTIEITFDRSIDPTSYAAGLTSPLGENISVYYESPAGGAKVLLPITAVTPLNANTVTGLGATEFAITFNPASLAGTTYGYVGTYSYVIAPTGIIGQDRTLSTPTVTAGSTASPGVFNFSVPAGSAATNTPPSATVTSKVTVTGLAGQFLIANPTNATLVNAAYPTGNVAGTFTGTITLIEPTAAPPAAASDYTVTLLTPNGQTITISSGSATFVNNGDGTTTTTVTYNAVEFTVAASNTVPANGAYTLKVTAGANETITINNGWQLRLNTDILGIAPPAAATNAFNVTPPTTATAAVTLTGLAGQFLNANAGTFTGTIVLVEPSSAPAGNATDYTVTLTTPSGQVVTITGGTATFAVNGNGTTTTTVTYTSAPFTVPVSNTYAANGTYTLKVSTSSQQPESITINAGWHFTVNTATVTAFASPNGATASSLTPLPYTTSSVTLTGYAGQYLIADPSNAALVNAAYPTGNVAGTFSGVVTLTEPTTTPAAAATDYSVTLVTPTGLVITLTGGVATFVVNSNGTTTTTVTFSADRFTVPVSFSVPVNGTYTVQVIAGSQSNELIEINSGWQLTLNSVLVTTPNNRGTAMDQNANGTSGQVTGDDYVVGQPTGFASYATGTLPLIVAGPHVTAVTPVAYNATTKTATSVVSTGSTINLVLNNTVSALEVTFDRNISVASFTTAQILSIFGPAGVVSLTGLTITPLTVYSSGGQVTYTNGTGADTFVITFPTQQISGTYTIQLGTGIVAADTSATTAAAIDSNTNAGLDALKGVATNGVTVPVTYASTTVPAMIGPATVGNGGAITDSVLSAPIVVPVDFPIQGDDTATGVSGITLTLNISYPTDPDLVAYLLAPDGVTKVNLFTNVGAGTNTANFSTTTFSDTASTSVDKAAAPFFGTFLPEQPFANLGPGTGNSNLDSLGTWTLVIQNAGNSSGTLNSWSLTFQKPISSTGLGEQPNDDSSASFQIFNLAANNALANSTWTAVGPAGITPSNGVGTISGVVSSIAVDPSDTTGNTVFVGTAGGGVWKTTDFLTTSPAGPTYVPLTDNGPSYAQNIGALAAFGQNNDPSQTIVFAGTGFAQEGTISSAGTPNTELNTGTGDGIIRSIDGGKTWTVLTGVSGSVYKIVVDPTPGLNGDAIVYAATTTGLFRSLDSGNSWLELAAGNATDVLLDPNSQSPTTHNLDTIYVAFSNVTSFDSGAYNGPVGIYYSVNQGQTLQPLGGELGKDPLLVTPGFPASPLPVQNSSTVTPNNANSAYIVLAKPALTTNTAENLAYQSWLFAAVENYNGTFQGLYVTKDAGENWTLVQLPNIPGTGSVKAAVPTNSTTGANSYDPTSSAFSQQGVYDLTLTVDPTNPNIVYIGGSENFQASGMIRVNLTDLYDAHNLTSGSNDQSDGGALAAGAQGGVTLNVVANGPATYKNASNFIDLRYAPNNGAAGTSPFNINATLVITNGASFINNGTGATWSLMDQALKANPGDATSTTNVHSVIDYVDPTTGDVRLLIADDSGVFTALLNPDGTMSVGTGSDVEPNYSRSGNLQDEELLDSASQPSASAATQAGAQFYASGTNVLAAQSDASVLTDGNLTWSDSGVLSPSPISPRSTAANSSINSSDRSGVGIATDQTGGSGSPTVFEYDIPILGGNLTDFFRVNANGQTTGLDGNRNSEFPNDGSNGDAHQGGVSVTPVTNSPQTLTDAEIDQSNFEVNPLNGNQIIIASATGNLYETTNQGLLWVPIGSANNFGLSSNDSISTMAYGAPDPNVTGGVGNLNNFIYVGTSGFNYVGSLPAGDTNDGQIFVTQAGGQGWTNISNGLDGSSIVGIYPDPDRGSHAAYAVTKTGIFYSPDTIGLAGAGQTVWTNITSNLTSLDFDAFNNPAYQQSVLAGFSYTPVNLTINGTANLAPATPYNPVFNSDFGGFTDIVADYRYEIPAPTNATDGTSIYYPVLYASGYGGVFRSVDNGVTWTVFPNQSFDNAPVDGGYLPDVDVTNLQLVLGDINPDTGHAVQATGDPEVLLATTYGRGDFAIRLAPDVIPASVVFDTSLPIPDGSDSSGGLGYTSVTDPYLDGVSEVSNFGDTVTINLYDESPNSPYKGTLVGTGTTNALGQFTVQILPNSDPWFNSISSTAIGDKVVGIQATDSSGASGNLTLFDYTLDLIDPNTPNPPVLEATYDTGRSTIDGLTNLSVPAQAGPGASLNIVTPTFDVTTPSTQANPLTPNPIALTIELLRASSPDGPFFVIDSSETGIINGAIETYMLTDPGLATLAAAGIDETFYYEALQIDEAGNVSTPASNVEQVTVNTIAPIAPTALSLVSLGTNSPPEPTFSVTGVLPNDQVLLYRSVNGGPPILVGSGAINTTGSAATLQVQDTVGASPDGIYTYYAAQLDVYGNFSPLTAGLQEIINTQTPPAAPILEAAYDTGRSTSDDVTNVAVPAPTPGSTPSYQAPVFNITTVAPTSGQPAIVTVELYRSTSPTGPFTIVGSSAFSGNPAMVTDTSMQNLLASSHFNTAFYYEADQINAAGITSAKSPALKVTVDNLVQAVLPAPTLDPASNTGLNKGSNITNITKPVFDVTNLAAGDQVFLYRSTGGAAPILVGTGAINTTGAAIATTVKDNVGAVPDGVYQYYVVQQDLAGNISNFSPAVAITINTTAPAKPTIALLTSDDTGLPSHPNVTNVNTPHFTGTSTYNAGTNFPVSIIDATNGAVLATTYPSANGTYLAQVITSLGGLLSLSDGVYTLEARTENLAGTFSYSSPLSVTIKHNGPTIVPNLMLTPATDTGIKGDGVTSNHNPSFTGTTNPGDIVSLYVLVNGSLLGPEATTTSSTVNGSFTFSLPFSLTDGSTALVAQTSDIAGNKGTFSNPYSVRITTTTSDYLGTGTAQLTLFDPYNETYYVRNTGSAQVDTTPGRDLPIQYDFNGDGVTDLAAYRYDSSTFYGYVSNGSAISYQYGVSGQSLPVSDYYGGSGTYLSGIYIPATGTWAIALPQPGGLVVNFGIPKLDVPVPGAYDGSGADELAVFRPSTFYGGDADSFTVLGYSGIYTVSFTSPAVQKLGFTYQPGDIPAPADYDGVGHDEFAIYRPSTGQFFILNTPSDTNTATWSLRVVTMNLPGGPKAGDEPVSADYDGDGKADPTVYRPSNSTFYELHSSTGLQSNIQFQPLGSAAGNIYVAAAGPIQYRLTALFGADATTGGYAATGSGGGSFGNAIALTVHAESITASAAASTASTTATPAVATPLSTTIALAMPIVVTTPVATVPTVTPGSSTSQGMAVTVGVSTPSAASAIITGPKVTTSSHAVSKKTTKHTVESSDHPATLAKDSVAKVKVKAHPAPTSAKTTVTASTKAATTKAASKAHTKIGALAAAAMQHLVMATKGRKQK